jgi:NAD(P)H-hydrate epimerase
MDSRLLYRTALVREMDRRAAALPGMGSFELMQRAGAAAWTLLRTRWPDARRIAIACGPGNNGGDGYVLARLAKANGCQVHVVTVSGSAQAPDAQRAWREWQEAGGSTHHFDGQLPAADVWVDALFGIGLDRAPTGNARVLIEQLNTARLPMLALDVPSGVDADTSCVPGVAIRATITLTFIAEKRGLHTGAARDFCGEVLLDSLRLPDNLSNGIAPAARLLRATDLAEGLPSRHANAHKGENGHVLCVGGETGMAGAIHLCAEAALRAGAGLVSVATRQENVTALVAARPEAMTHAVEDAAALRPLLDRADVLAVGPGLGRGEWGRALFEAALASGKPLILDADGLNLLAEHPQPLPQAILTPHPGEAARLLGMSNQQIQDDRFAAVEELARRYQCTVVLKGAGTLVAASGEVTAVIDAGNPGMATGGMGDVLTGVIAALQAQRLPRFQAAIFGALLHGAAGDAAAYIGGERGLLPSDMFPQLRRLGNPE